MAAAQGAVPGRTGVRGEGGARARVVRGAGVAGTRRALRKGGVGSAGGGAWPGWGWGEGRVPASAACGFRVAAAGLGCGGRRLGGCGRCACCEMAILGAEG